MLPCSHIHPSFIPTIPFPYSKYSSKHELNKRNINEHVNVQRGKSIGPQTYTENYRQIRNVQLVSFPSGACMASPDFAFFLPAFSLVFPAYLYSALCRPKTVSLLTNGIHNIQRGNPISHNQFQVLDAIQSLGTLQELVLGLAPKLQNKTKQNKLL